MWHYWSWTQLYNTMTEFYPSAFQKQTLLRGGSVSWLVGENMGNGVLNRTSRYQILFCLEHNICLLPTFPLSAPHSLSLSLSCNYFPSVFEIFLCLLLRFWSKPNFLWCHVLLAKEDTGTGILLVIGSQNACVVLVTLREETVCVTATLEGPSCVKKTESGT